MKSLSKQPEERFQRASEMTLALAKALKLPIPQVLQASAHTATLSPSPDLRSTLPPSMTPSGNFIPQQQVIGTQDYSSGNAQRGMSNRDTPAGAIWSPAISPAYPLSQPGLQNQGMPFVPQAAPSAAPPAGSQGKRAPLGRGGMIIIAVVLLFILAGIGNAVFTPFAQHTSSSTPSTPVANVEVGTIQFSHSPNAIAGDFDQVQITMHNVPNPPAGRVYYAWIESKAELTPPNWKLTVSGGKIQTGTLTYNNKNLLTAGNILLITTETPNPAPNVPFPTTRRYYASLDNASATSFSIKSCPTDNNNNICSQ